ncbi:MAG: translocation/assembly module TamB [Muribaculaceae bacterium]|nr:translocation/assembly module TamB [Muribaculaceae bacterium]
MKKLMRALRLVLLSVLSLVVAVPVALYVLLSTPWAQTRLCRAAQSELSELLGTRISVGSVTIHPFNRVDVSDVSVADDNGRECLTVERLSARFELYHFLRTGRTVFDYAFVDHPDVHIYRDSKDAPLNIAGIIRRLKGNDSGTKKNFRIKVATIALLDGRVSYDVLDCPEPQQGRFDPNHVRIDSLQLHACLRLASQDAVDVELNRAAMVERSGFELKQAGGQFRYDAAGIRVEALKMELPNSRLNLDADYESNRRAWHIATDTAEASLIYLPDLTAFVPAFSESYLGVEARIHAHGDKNSAMLDSLRLHTLDESMVAEAEGGIIKIGMPDENAWISRLDVRADMPRIVNHLERFMHRNDKLPAKLSVLGTMRMQGTASLRARSDARISLKASTAGGNITAEAEAFSADTFATAQVRAEATLDEVEAGRFAGVARLGAVNAGITARGDVSRGGFDGRVVLQDASVDFNGRKCGGIDAVADISGSTADIDLNIDDRAVRVDLNSHLEFASRADKSMTLKGMVDRLDLNWLGLISTYEGYTLSASVDAALDGNNADDVQGFATLENVDFSSVAEGRGLRMQSLSVVRDLSTRPEIIELNSDYINGTIQGHFRPSSLVSDVRESVASVFPALNLGGEAAGTHSCRNDFRWELAIANADELSRFFALPVQIIHPIEISGSMNCVVRKLDILLDAPYLQQGDKIIDNTALFASSDGFKGRASVYATTHMPTKKGPMLAVLDVSASDDVVNTAVDWTIERSIPLNGTLSASTRLGRGADGRISADVDLHPGSINFGDDVWSILPSHVAWSDGVATIDDFALQAGEQQLKLDGVVCAASEPVLDINIRKVSLLPIFETLEIDKALLSGIATGRFEGRALLSSSPVLTSEWLHVDDIGYNRCTLGDADISAAWNNATKAVELNADLTGPDGRHSAINGSITPASEELDITFLADRVRVGFMQPFMSAFASDVDGYASGRARLFGTFKYIDLEGDIYADSLSLKIDFTNTTYFCSDSVHLRPGNIDVKDAVIRDTGGQTARLDGTVRHKFFKEPSFDFTLRDAREFLCYNVGPKQSPDWYGTIYGNGGAHISGEPGVVNIDVTMTTTAGSTFTFVLSDMMEADEYSFITFRDRTPVEIVDSVVEVETIPAAVLEYRDRMARMEQDEESDYNMDFKVDITPAARIVLVMDPVGGDEIRAYGNGNVRLTYGSANNDLRMFGTYTLDRGSYNFTLQDIIIKDFTIDEGSSISFHGDPYAAQLNIEAAYNVNANLSDLDESFLQDRDLNRTNVPVQAIMKVTGDMRQPDIAFDLRFPTLTSDVYRKVRSIVSTEEMMNRQIIYLLALNRFYTPDYMSTTKGNELFSVASSTISSQLSSMLGKLSDNWTIAPNLRSDRGDFSDVEVDVALSSRLLNNRLLFNGNFGYRDKSLNTNQFVGDFDIEYLLNRRGTWRLKAYNRYNDQNYYLRSAATTQGVGIMFKRDFDDLFRRHNKAEPKEEKSDTAGAKQEVPQSCPQE